MSPAGSGFGWMSAGGQSNTTSGRDETKGFSLDMGARRFNLCSLNIDALLCPNVEGSGDGPHLESKVVVRCSLIRSED